MSWLPSGWLPSGWNPPNWLPGEGDSPAPEATARVSFRPRPSARTYRAEIGANGDLFFEDCYKDAADTLPVRLVFSEVEGIAQFWQRDEKVDALEHARPTTPTGFAYRTDEGGRTGATEPPWPTTLGQTVVDGSVTWTCVEAALNGFTEIQSPVAAVGPMETPTLTATEVAVEEGVNIIADYAGGENGEDYEVVFSFGVAGRARRARQRVLIRKR